MDTISELGPPIGEREVAQFERDIGARLPADYRAFLLACNGGSPSPEMIAVPGFQEDGGFAEVRTLFSIDHSTRGCSLQWNFGACRNTLRDGLIPIGHDSVGDLYCLDVSTEAYGQVFFVDMLLRTAATDAGRLYPIAASFQEMLDQLRPRPSAP